MSRAALFVFLAVALAACGGSGGSDLPGATSAPGGSGGGSGRGGSSGGGAAAGDAGHATGDGGPSDGGATTDAGSTNDGGSTAGDGGSLDSGTRGPPAGCVGHVTWPTPAAGTWYTVDFLLLDLETDAGVANATIALCPSDAGNCANPVAQADNLSDTSGAATLTGPASAAGLDGYLQITANEYVPLLGYFPAVNNVAFYGSSPTIPVAMIATVPTFTEMATQLGVKFDSSLGHVLFTVTDCNGQPLAGATVACSLSDGNTKTAYMAGGVLSPSATETDASGRGLLANVKSGVGTLTATLKGSGPTGRLDVAVRQAAVTEVTLPPTPL